MNAIQPIRRALYVVALGITLAACTPPAANGPTGSAASTPSQPAAVAAARGDYDKAVQLYMDAAGKASSADARDRYRLRAGLAAAQSGDTQTAKQILDSIEITALKPADQSLYGVARREVSIANLAPSQALHKLPPPSADTFPEVAAHVWSKRAELLFAANRPIDGLQALGERDALLRSPQLIRANDDRTYDRALDATGLGLGPNSRDAADAGQTVQGWLALANIGANGYADTDQRDSALAQWQSHYPDHPAQRSVLADRFDYNAGGGAPPAGGASTSPAGAAGKTVQPSSKQVALALPLNGQFSNAAQAIRDGFLFAYQNNSDGLPKPLIYDSSHMQASQILAHAQQDNVGALVGPLAKPKVSAMAGLQSQMPEIALNYLDNAVNRPGFYQFALSPEDEARAAARQASETGYTSAIALVPQGDWGNRVLDAFRQQFGTDGGQLVKYVAYDSDAHDHSQAIRQVLSGTQTDFIFVAAQPTQARLIRSQLKYYHAAGLPMITTSHAYTGQPDPAQDVDLNDVHFVDMPWILGNGATISRLRRLAGQEYGDEASAYARLFAMGMDAWLLTRKIEHQGLTDGDVFQGMTGILKIKPDDRIQRYLAWAVFRSGRARLKQLPSRSDAEMDTRTEHYSSDRNAPGNGRSGNTNDHYVQPGPSTNPMGNNY